MMSLRSIVLAIVGAVTVAVIAAFWLTWPTPEPTPDQPVAAIQEPAAPAASSVAAIAAPANDILVIEVAGQSSGIIEIELLADVAPNHAARIKALALAGKYDGVIFHRVIDGFMAQTGDVRYGHHDADDTSRAGSGGSDMPDLQAEFSDLAFDAGMVGMARSQQVNSANSQFFIMFDAAHYLNRDYTIVGRVISGQDVVDAIKKGSVAQNGLVANPDYMKSVTIRAGG